MTTGDHFVFDPDWYDRIIEAHRSFPDAAIGGAVENGSRDRLMDWTAYICEYGKFMLPFEPRPEVDLPGPNVSYRRHVLEQACGDLLDQGLWERALHTRMAERGFQLWLMPSLVVYYTKTFEFRDFLAQRYYFGRSFAARGFDQRRRSDSTWRCAQEGASIRPGGGTNAVGARRAGQERSRSGGPDGHGASEVCRSGPGGGAGD